ncbi:MAG: hypothetical protein JWR63_3699 [Conexibacter sp.]|nr:hypothetical protein [Conexibacter sp.]
MRKRRCVATRPKPLTEFVAWVGLPLLFVAMTAGLGAATSRAFRAAVPGQLLIPLGTSVAILLALTGFRVGLPLIAVVIAVLLPALVGLAFVKDFWPSRRSDVLWPAVTFGAIWLLVMAPVLLSGHWTWTGYNFVNDTAVQMLLADHLASNGLRIPAASSPTASTASEVVRVYLTTGYPVGIHSLLAVLHALLPGELAPLYQPMLGVLAGTTSLALFHLARIARLAAPLAAGAALAALSSNLTYQYVLQGNVKELALITTLATAVALGSEVIKRAELGMVMLWSAALAAILAVYSFAGLPFIGVTAALVVSSVAMTQRRRWRWLLFRAGPLALASFVVCSAAALITVLRFGEVVNGTFATAPARAADFGHLLRPLKAAQTAGVWLASDYRVPVLGTNGALTDALTAVVICLAIFGAWALARHQRLAPLLMIASAVIPAIVLHQRLSPYANGKLLAIASVGVVFSAAIGTARVWERSRGLAVWAGALLAVGVLLSDAYAFHGVKLAPADRMEALHDVGVRYAGRRMLINEPDEFAKFFAMPALTNVSSEAITPRQVVLRTPQGFQNRFFDLDAQDLSFVESFALIAVRRSPIRSRPPSNYHLAYSNAYYEVWERQARRETDVLVHLPLQGSRDGIAQPACSDIRALMAEAEPGDELLVAERPSVVELDTATAEHSSGWAMHPYVPDTLITNTPGYSRAYVRAPAGRYVAWIQGTFGRPVTGLVDGQSVGAISGVQTTGQWHRLGVADLVKGGEHLLEVRRAGGSFRAGDGYEGELGPMVLQSVKPERLRSVPLAGALSLCGGARYDWVELVRR